MAIRIDAEELRAVLTLTPPDQNILLVGRHGIGKSEILTAHYRDRGMRVVPFFLGQMSDPGDLIGLFHKDEPSGRSVFLPPWWWPPPDRPIVLFLDELNRARPELLQAVQDLALNRTLAGKTLPAGSIVVAAVNEGEDYQVTDLDPALVSRFNVYEFAPTVEDWLQWANREGLDARVVRFVAKNPEHLDGGSSAFGEGIAKTPDRRGWARVAALVAGIPRIEKLHIKLVAGVVGTTAALAFERSLTESVRATPDDVLVRFRKKEKALRALPLPEIILLDEQIVRAIDAGHVADADQARSNLLAWLRALRADKNQEAIAHLAAMLEEPRYASVMAWAAESADLVDVLVEYVRGIRL